ncbi:hypothetical protein [Streptomyces humi]
MSHGGDAAAAAPGAESCAVVVPVGGDAAKAGVPHAARVIARAVGNDAIGNGATRDAAGKRLRLRSAGDPGKESSAVAVPRGR